MTWFALAPATRSVLGLRSSIAQSEHGGCLDAPERIPSGRYSVVTFPNRRGEPVNYVLVGTVPREP